MCHRTHTHTTNESNSIFAEEVFLAQYNVLNIPLVNIFLAAATSHHRKSKENRMFRRFKRKRILYSLNMETHGTNGERTHSMTKCTQAKIENKPNRRNITGEKKPDTAYGCSCYGHCSVFRKKKPRKMHHTIAVRRTCE